MRRPGDDGGADVVLPARRRLGALAAGLLLLATLVAYVPAIRGGFVWDDDHYVTDNRALREPGGLGRIWTDTAATPQYYPLTHTTFWIEYRLWRLDPAGYHVVNVLLHAASALLVAGLLRRLGVPGAWLAAAIFALHPVHVESVAWITERKNTLSVLLYLASASVYLRWALARNAGGRRQPLLPAAALGLFVAALLSKTVTASLPVALAIVLWWKTGRVERRHWPWLGVMLVLGAALGSLTSYLEKVQVGAVGPEFDLSLAERTLIAGRALWFYLSKLVWPYPLAFNYSRWAIDAGEIAQWAWPVAALACGVALWLARHRIGRGPLAAGLFFAVSLAPALGYFDVFPMRYSFVADHFQYLASLGPIALGAAWLARGWHAVAAARLPPAAGPAAAGLLLALLGGLTWHQAGAYEDLETLWRRTIAVTPDAFMARYNLGKLLQARGEHAAAMAQYREALRVKPDLAPALVNVANRLAETGRRKEAIKHYLRAVEADPERALTWYNLGLTLQETGRPGEAEAAYREAALLDPTLGAARSNLAILLYRRGVYEEAWAELREARRLGVEPHPGFVRALTEAHPPP